MCLASPSAHDIFSGEQLVPEGITHPICSVLALIWFIIEIDSYLIMSLVLKLRLSLTQTSVTLADFWNLYPFGFIFLPNRLNYVAFRSFDLEVI